MKSTQHDLLKQNLTTSPIGSSYQSNHEECNRFQFISRPTREVSHLICYTLKFSDQVVFGFCIFKLIKKKKSSFK